MKFFSGISSECNSDLPCTNRYCYGGHAVDASCCHRSKKKRKNKAGSIERDYPTSCEWRNSYFSLLHSTTLCDKQATGNMLDFLFHLFSSFFLNVSMNITPHGLRLLFFEGMIREREREINRSRIYVTTENRAVWCGGSNLFPGPVNVAHLFFCCRVQKLELIFCTPFAVQVSPISFESVVWERQNNSNKFKSNLGNVD